MKRDMDLCRAILKATEASPDADLDISDTADLGFKEEVSLEQYGYHCRLLADAGLVTGISLGTVHYRITGLTWAGHEFLDDIRSDTVWNQTKKQVGEKVGTASVAIMQAVAQQLAKSLMGLS